MASSVADPAAEFRAFVAEQLRHELSSAERRLLDTLAAWTPLSPGAEARSKLEPPLSPRSVEQIAWKKHPRAAGNFGGALAIDGVIPSEPASPVSPASGRLLGKGVEILTIDPGGKLSPDTASTSDAPGPSSREAWASERMAPRRKSITGPAPSSSVVGSVRASQAPSTRTTRFAAEDKGKRPGSSGGRPGSGGGRPTSGGKRRTVGMSKREGMSITVGSFLRQTTNVTSGAGDDMEEWAPHSSNKFQAFVENLVCSQNFDFVSAFLIMANALSIGTQTDYMARTQSELLPLSLRVVEVFFCIAFALELFLRLYVFRLRFFYMQGAMWNLMDFVLVLLQVTEELVALILDLTGASSDESSIGGTAPSLLRLLRILRLVRVLRVMRVLRFIGELRSLVISLLGCMRPFFWTLVLLFLILYLFAVYFTQLVLNHRAERGELTPDLEQNFGSLFVSLLVLYQSMTGGIDWQEAVDPLVHDISPFVGVIFVFYIAFTSLAMTNVLTGIFVESALLRAKEDRELVTERTARELFSKVDIDGDGTITWAEFENQMANKDVIDLFQLIGMNVSDARGIYSLLDIDGNGIVDAEEFLNGCLQLRRSAKSLDLLMLSFETRQVFQAQNSQMSQMEGKVSAMLDALKAPQGPLRDLKSPPPSGWGANRELTVMSP